MTSPPVGGEAQEAATNEALRTGLRKAVDDALNAYFEALDIPGGLARRIVDGIWPSVAEALGSLRRDNEELALKVAVREQAHDAAQSRLTAALTENKAMENRIRALHAEVATATPTHCRDCLEEPWPCATIRVLEETK